MMIIKIYFITNKIEIIKETRKKITINLMIFILGLKKNRDKKKIKKKESNNNNIEMN